jgi:geranylgeranyl diphosphate synthase type II
LEFSTPEKASELEKLFSSQLDDNTDKIEIAKAIFNESGGSKATQEAIKQYTFKAFETLEKMDIELPKKEMLRTFGENLMGRKV